jgi:hypothetical protein
MIYGLVHPHRSLDPLVFHKGPATSIIVKRDEIDI